MGRQTVILHLILIFLVAFGARISVFALAGTANFEHPEAWAFYSASAEGDAINYVRLGENLSRFGVYAEYMGPPVIPHAERGPGYPLAMAAIFTLVSADIAFFLLLQVVFGAVLACGVYLLARMLAPAGAALAAGLLFALDGPSIIYANLVMTETLAAGILLLAVYFLAGILRDDAPAPSWKWVAVGLTLAALAYVRTAFLFLPFALLVACAVRSNTQWRELLRRGALICGAFALGILPWCLRNQVVFGHFAFSSGAGKALCTWNALQFAAPENIGMNGTASSAETQHDEMVAWLEENIGPAERNPFEADAEFRSIGWPILRVHMRELPRAFAVAAARTLFGPGRGYFMQLETATGLPFSQIGMGLWGLWMGVFLAYIAGTVVLWRRPEQRAVAALVLLVVAYAVAVAFLQGYSRFRVPVLPAIYAVSAVGLHGLWRLIIKHKKSVAGAGAKPMDAEN